MTLFKGDGGLSVISTQPTPLSPIAQRGSHFVVTRPARNSSQISLKSHLAVLGKDTMDNVVLGSLHIGKRRDGHSWNAFDHRSVQLISQDIRIILSPQLVGSSAGLSKSN